MRMEKPAKSAPRRDRPAITFRSTTARAAQAADEGARTFLAVRLPTVLLTQIKTAAVQQRRKLQDVAEEAFTDWLANRR
jgi:hypothetical protein